MKKKTKIVITSYVLAALTAMGGLALMFNARAEGYRLQLENTYQHAFSELVTNVSDLDNALQKTLYAGTPSMLGSVCTEVYGCALAAQYALSEMPFSSYEYENTAGFITRAGDYALMLAKKAGAKEMGSQEEHDNLASLSQTATVLAGNLNQLRMDVGMQSMTAAQLKSVSEKAAELGDAATEGSVEGSFSLMEGEFPETPSLIYDGPFSSHIAGMTPKMIENEPSVTAEQARKTAADFMGINERLVKSNGERAGSLPVYMFYANTDGGTTSIEVTVQGGVVVSAFNSRIVKQSVLTADEAVGLAERFLKDRGFSGMKQSYQIENGNTLIVNYAYTEQDVVCYTDLIKVYVALDNGKVIGFEAQGYVMHHTARTIPEATVGEDEAQAKISPYLTVLSHQMAVIPTSGKNEIFCHEFKCENTDGSHYIVYINAETGREEKILILIEDETGTLTI